MSAIEVKPLSAALGAEVRCGDVRALKRARRRFMAEPKRALLGPDDLVAEPGEAGRGHHQQRRLPAAAAGRGRRHQPLNPMP